MPPHIRVYSIILAVLVIALIALRVGTAVLHHTRRAACLDHLQQIGRAARMYHDDHAAYPQVAGSFLDVTGQMKIQLLYDSGHLGDPDVVYCPVALHAPPSWAVRYNVPTYLWALEAPTTVLAACGRPHGQGELWGRNVLYVGGEVRWVPEEEFLNGPAKSLTSW